VYAIMYNKKPQMIIAVQEYSGENVSVSKQKKQKQKQNLKNENFKGWA